MVTSSYDYSLPKSQIALTPAQPVDSAKLLIYKREDDSITHTTWSKILDYLPKNVAIFLNDTKVIKARIFGKKTTGWELLNFF